MEIRQRLQAALPGQPEIAAQLHVHTLHSLARELLVLCRQTLQQVLDPRVLDDESLRLLTTVWAQDTGVFHGYLQDASQHYAGVGVLVTAFDLFAGAALSRPESLAAAWRRQPEAQHDLELAREKRLEFPFPEAALLKTYDQFRRLGHRLGWLTFNQLMASLRYQLERSSRFTQAIRERVQVLLVDEVQDATPTQLDMVREILGTRAEVTFVGDFDQAIYQFRGAYDDQTLAKIDAWPGLVTETITANFRSQPVIVETVNWLRQSSAARQQAAREGLPAHPVVGLTTESAEEMARQVIQLAQRAFNVGNRWGDLAIISRSARSKDIAALTAALRAAGIPVQSQGSVGYLSEPDLKALRLLLHLAAGNQVHGSDALAALRLWFNVEPRDVAEIELGDLALREVTRADVIAFLEKQQPPGWEAATRAIAHAERASLVGLLWHVLDQAPLLKEILRSGNWVQAQRLTPLFRLASKAEALALGSPKDMLHAIDRFVERERVPEPRQSRDDALEVLTVHASKGREFPIVILYPASSWIWQRPHWPETVQLPPPYGPFGREAYEQHRRQEHNELYVAVSRAKQHLVVAHAKTSTNGYSQRVSAYFAQMRQELKPDRWLDISQSDDMPLTAPDATSQQETAGLSEGPVWSYHRAHEMQSCPRRAWFKHDLELPEVESEAAWMGKVAHRAVVFALWEGLEWTAASQRAWEQLSGYRPVRSRQDVDTALASVKLPPVSIDTFLAYEMKLDGAVDGQPLTGSVDLVSRGERGVVLWDLKSRFSRHVDPLQLSVYQLLWEQTHQDPIERLVFWSLDEGKPQDVEMMPHRLLESVVGDLISGAANLFELGVVEGRPGDRCQSCSFRPICPEYQRTQGVG